MCNIGAQLREVEFEPVTTQVPVDAPALPVERDRNELAPQRG